MTRQSVALSESSRYDIVEAQSSTDEPAPAGSSSSKPAEVSACSESRQVSAVRDSESVDPLFDDILRSTTHVCPQPGVTVFLIRRTVHEVRQDLKTQCGSVSALSTETLLAELYQLRLATFTSSPRWRTIPQPSSAPASSPTALRSL